MNFAPLVPAPNIGINKPVKVSARGNVYKIPVSHMGQDGKTVNQFEIWATKEAVQKHFGGMTEEPKEYELKKFARQTYEKQLRTTGGQFQHKGILVTSDNVTHGDPTLWPSTLSHPEVKL